jgi:hypothetical protein
MALPARGIISSSEPTRRGPIEDRLNSLPNPRGGFRFLLPNRLHCFHHKRHVNLLNGQRPDHWRDIRPQRLRPLLEVSGAAPTGLVSVDIRFSALREGHRPRGLQPLRRASGLAGIDRVMTITMQLSSGRGPFAGLRERHIIQGTEAHEALTAVVLEPENPGPADRASCGVDRDLQIKPATIWVTARSRGPQFQRGKFMQCHCCFPWPRP